MNFEKFYYILELIGTAAFASSGAMIAIRKGMDIFGIIVLAIMTAIGGGVFRDLVLGINPPTAFLNTTYTTISIIISIFIILILKYNTKKENFLNKKFLLFYVKIVSFLDAIGLGLFTVSGVRMAMKMGYIDNIFLLLFVGISTGCGGGVLRDLCSGTIPIIFTKNTIYAMASFLGAVTFIFLRPYIRHYAFLLGAIVVVISRLLSMKYR